MSEYQQLLLLSEFDAVWPGTPRPLDELLPSSILIEVESLSELRMQIHAVKEEIDLRNNFEEGDFGEEEGDFREEEGDFGEEEGDFGVVEFDPSSSLSVKFESQV